MTLLDFYLKIIPEAMSSIISPNVSIRISWKILISSLFLFPSVAFFKRSEPRIPKQETLPKIRDNHTCEEKRFSPGKPLGENQRETIPGPQNDAHTPASFCFVPQERRAERGQTSGIRNQVKRASERENDVTVICKIISTRGIASMSWLHYTKDRMQSVSRQYRKIACEFSSANVDTHSFHGSAQRQVIIAFTLSFSLDHFIFL